MGCTTSIPQTSSPSKAPTSNRKTKQPPPTTTTTTTIQKSNSKPKLHPATAPPTTTAATATTANSHTHEKKAGTGGQQVRPGLIRLKSKDVEEDQKHPFNQPLDNIRAEENEMAVLSRATGFSPTIVRELHTVFNRVSAAQVDDNLIDYHEFAQALNMDGDSEIVRALFRRFDRSKDDNLNFREFITSLSRLSTHATPADRQRFIFDVWDLNGDGTISIDELETLVSAALQARDGAGILLEDVALTKEDIHDMCVRTIEELDRDGDGQVSYDEYQHLHERAPWLDKAFAIDVEAALTASSSHTSQKLHHRMISENDIRYTYIPNRRNKKGWLSQDLSADDAASARVVATDEELSELLR